MKFISATQTTQIKSNPVNFDKISNKRRQLTPLCSKTMFIIDLYHNNGDEVKHNNSNKTQ